MKKRLLLLAILPLSLHAADVPPDVKPELQVNTADPNNPKHTTFLPSRQTGRLKKSSTSMPTPCLPIPTYWHVPCIPPLSPTTSPASKPFCPFTNNGPNTTAPWHAMPKVCLPNPKGAPPKPSAITAALSPISPTLPPSAGSLQPPYLKTNKTKPRPTSSTNCKPNPSRLPCKNASKPTTKPCANATHGNSTPA